eukprot:3158573-Rhodomonas_salina.2
MNTLELLPEDDVRDGAPCSPCLSSAWELPHDVREEEVLHSDDARDEESEITSTGKAGARK